MSIIQNLPLSRFEVDRAASVRADSAWLERAWANDATRVLLVRGHQVPVTSDLSLIWVNPSSISLGIKELVHHAILLGIGDNGVNSQVSYIALVDDDIHAIELDDESGNESEVIWAHLRDIGAQLSAHDIGLSVTAVAMSQWHKTHTHCPRCGSRTSVSQAGWARHCDTDNSDHFPRTEPAMIVAVSDSEDRILLGRRVGWAPGWFSTLAGFVEAGESAEACVIREVFEESGIRVDPDSLRYVGSQPWPYPASLMLGYRAVALQTAIKVDEEEMAEVQWFSREEFIDGCRSKSLLLPNSGTIAWHLIADWFGEAMPKEWSR